jgi:hypothetical protein
MVTLVLDSVHVRSTEAHAGFPISSTCPDTTVNLLSIFNCSTAHACHICPFPNFVFLVLRLSTAITNLVLFLNEALLRCCPVRRISLSHWNQKTTQQNRVVQRCNGNVAKRTVEFELAVAYVSQRVARFRFAPSLITRSPSLDVVQATHGPFQCRCF